MIHKFKFIFYIMCLVAMTDVYASDITDFDTLYNTIVQLDWGNSHDADEYRLYTNVVNLKNNLDKNLQLLQQNYQDAKDNEQSLANRTMTAASMAATGIGGMMLAQATAEQNADEQAERDMQAYIASMRCDYADGKHVNHGETNIELPGANELFDTYNQYVTLANDVKERKNALGLKPGVESDVIMDTSGLYEVDDTGGTNGTYTSLYRAITDASSDDAKQFAEQKNETADRLKTGAIAAAAGVAVGVIGNQVINGGKATDKSAQLLQEREYMMNQVKSILDAKIKFCNDNVMQAREFAQEIESNPDLQNIEVLRNFANAARNAQGISDVSELGSNPLCPK